jgi:virginiamycin B lyase
MGARLLLLTVLIGGPLLGCSRPPETQTQAAAAPALSGTVSSAEDGALEGVVVSAKKGVVTVSVVSDGKGAFRFPAGRLPPGDYAISIRAAGYDLAGPQTVSLGNAPVDLPLKLAKAKDLAAQLTNLEWMLSVPGTDQEKRLISGCTNCHTVARIMNSTHDAAEWQQVIQRMAGYSNNSFFRKPQMRAVSRDLIRFTPNGLRDAAYLASINRSKGELQYPLKVLPRVTGAGTRALITEYDLPRQDSQPHDVYVDPDGIVWYSDYGDQFLGRLDTRTLQVKEYPVPLHRETFPKGALDLEPDRDGNLWLGLMFQAGVARFDRKTQKVETFPLPKNVISETSQQAMVAPQSWQVDGKVWMTETNIPGVRRLDVDTGTFESFAPYKDLPPPHSVYSIMADAGNNLWFLDYGGENIGRIDARTGQVSLYPTPTPRSRPRRGRFDDQGRIWFAEFNAERIGVFDTRTHEFQEWVVPGKFFAPYDVAYDKEGKVWVAGMNADRVLRLDPKNGRFDEYPLPHVTNVRRIFVDNSTPRPTLWIGNNHGAAIIKLELPPEPPGA